VSLMVVGSIALDSVRTPAGHRDEALGGSAVYFSLAAAPFVPTRVVGVVGSDFPEEHLALLRRRGIDLEGLQYAQGRSFRWAGDYGEDPNDRETLRTELGVFKDFHPVLPPSYRDSRHVFLGNIQPRLQCEVLDQVTAPTLVAGDTMDFWIEGQRKELEETLQRIDVLVVNDTELRQLAGDANLLKASRKVLSMGPARLVVKKGEHGAMLLWEDDCFWVPGLPLDEVRDPTGAGDSFAGGFMGYLSQGDTIDVRRMKEAMIYGSVMASFCVEHFSVDGLVQPGKAQIRERYRRFVQLVSIEEKCELPE
jgi:sugar/nucleoside kinase (ribokinase family)